MRIRFDRGTLVLEAEHTGEDPRRIPGATWDDERRAWRVPAGDHEALIGRLADAGVRASVETRTARLDGEWVTPVLRWYQREALERWHAAHDRGVIALPTGSGKTVVALAAIAKLAVATLILVPTRVLLDQWARAIEACWPHPVGRLGDGDHQVLPITVATYASAMSWAPRIGDRFGLVVIDEAHHVGAWCASEILEMLIAPARLGLTATPPEDPRPLAQHVGGVIYTKRPEELVGDGLSPYTLETIPIVLTREERERYRDHRARFSSVYAPFVRSAPETSWVEFVRAARQTKSGREALASWRAYRSLIAYPAGKRRALTELLARHRGERTLVFTSDNATTYAIARELLITPITHEINRTERSRALARFKSGEISVLVSSQVLDEGLDVPDAEVAIVVGGSASRRRHVQRIGRVLRPRENKQARIYELAVEETLEVGYVKRRHDATDATQGTAFDQVLATIGGAP